MNINLYVRSHFFNSSTAAVKLACKNDKYQTFAENLLLKKLEKVSSTPKSYNLQKASKYNKLINTLHLNSTSHAYYQKYQSLIPELNTAKQSITTEDNKRAESPSGEIQPNTAHAERDEVIAAARIELLNSREHISDMKKGILIACDKVIDDEGENMQSIRRIVTNLKSLSLTQNENLVLTSNRFLEHKINGTNFTAYGDKDNYNNETLQKVKDHINDIKNWIIS